MNISHFNELIYHTINIPFVYMCNMVVTSFIINNFILTLENTVYIYQAKQSLPDSAEK